MMSSSVKRNTYELLLKQAEPEAQNIATALEIYVNGSLNVFNHQSNIDMNNHRVLWEASRSFTFCVRPDGMPPHFLNRFHISTLKLPVWPFKRRWNSSTHSGPGEGLLFFGNVIIPFVDHFPKDTLLYSVLTTRPDEVAPGRSRRRRGVPDPQQAKIRFALPGVHTFLRMGITDWHPGIFLFPLKFFFPRHCYHLQSFLDHEPARAPETQNHLEPGTSAPEPRRRDFRYEDVSFGKLSTKGIITFPKNRSPSPGPEWVT
mgnify:CR=1 FL=1